MSPVSQLLFLDEATSGLDSFLAESLVRSLADYAHGPGARLVLLTVHQPSAAIFGALDSVMCLLDGQLAFHGPPGEVLPAFAAAGYGAPPGLTAPEHMLTVINVPEVAAQVAAGTWPALPGGPDQPGRGGAKPAAAAAAQLPLQRPPAHGLAREAVLLWTRSLRMLMRSPGLVLMHSVLSLLVGTLMGVAFLSVQTDIRCARASGPAFDPRVIWSGRVFGTSK